MQTEFKRGLTLFDSTMIVVGSMIGSGIFIVSADIARNVGSPGLLLIIWGITGIMTLIGALSYGELASMMPAAGGQYVYLKEAYNPFIGFLYGWTFFLVIQTGTIAAVGVAFAKFTSIFFPWFSEKNILFSQFGINFSAAQLLSILSIILLTGVNLVGLKEGKIVQNIFTISKTVALLAVIILGLFFVSNASAIQANFSNFWDASWTKFENGKIISIEKLSGVMIFAAMGTAMIGSFFSSDAWNNITFTAGEVINPKKNIPLSLAIGTILVSILYVLANLSFILLLPLKGDPNGADVISRGIQFASFDRVGTAASSLIFGDTAVYVMGFLIMISTFGCNNGLILAGARVYYAMAKDGLFFKKVGELNKHSVPGWALVLQGIWASALCLSGKYSDLLDYAMMAAFLFYILTIAGIFILRKKNPNAERPYKAFGYPILPIIYILVISAICIDILIFKPAYTWPGVYIVLSGIPVYFFWKKFSVK